MKCPVDKIDTIVVEHHEIEFDYCLKCQGVWFDSGELDLLITVLIEDGVTATPAADMLKLREADTHEHVRRCPVCNQKMDKVWIGDESKILIDSCPLGDGLWFDGGELHQVIRQMGQTNPEGVISFLGDALKADSEI